MTPIPEELRTITFPEKVYLKLEDIAAEERKKAEDFRKPLITPKSVAQKILAVGVEAKGKR